jgi:TonB family protein
MRSKTFIFILGTILPISTALGAVSINAAVPLQEQSPAAQKQATSETVVPDVSPRLLSKTEPSYTKEARHAMVNAIITCNLIVSKDGVPQNIRVIRAAGFGLDEKAVEALSTWRFAPGLKNGVPVATMARIAVSFRLNSLDGREGKHKNQIVRLNFKLPPGSNSPELVSGRVPENRGDSEYAKVSVTLTVGTDGKPRETRVLESTSSEWADEALREIEHWQFRPATMNNSAIEVEGTFEIVRTPNGILPPERPPSSEKPSDQPPHGDVLPQDHD